MFRLLGKPFFFLFVALLGLSLAMPAMARRGPSAGSDAPSEDQLEVRKLRQQIAAIELLDALALDEEQREALTELVADVVGQKAEAKEQRESRASELREILEDYLSQVQKQGTPKDSTVEDLRTFREEKRSQNEGRKETRKNIAQQLKDTLSQEQMEVLQSFRPMSSVGADPDRQEAREERRERREEKIRTRFGDERAEKFEAKREKRGDRKRARKVARTVLFSEAMLEALQR